ncbi:multifunctional CCA addition/repair protein, partial [Burkholderia cenocepacia]
ALAPGGLTATAMAGEVGPEGTLVGEVMPPFAGQADLRARVLRHVSDAFVEDPVRILGMARFAARFADFTVADETRALMRRMVDAGEVDALGPERVWQEIARGLMEAKPTRMVAVLRECGALGRNVREGEALWGVRQRAEYHPEGDTGGNEMVGGDSAAMKG